MNKMKHDFSKPALYMMRGPSCSGKSTTARKLVEEQGVSEYNIISSDMFRGYLFGDDSFQRGNNILFELLYSIIKTRFSNRASFTVYDATNLSISDSRPVLEIAQSYGIQTFMYSHTSGCDLEKLKANRDKRVANGGMYISNEVIERHLIREKNCRQDFIRFENENSDWFMFIEV